MKKDLSVKLKRLRNILRKMQGVLIAYSGGVDSTLLLKVAGEVLKDQVLAVIASSPTYPQRERKEAKRLAADLGVENLVIKTHEINNPRFVSNPLKRCYFCKQELFSRLKRIAKRYDISYVCDGSNYDDLKDFRPGAIAKKELGIRSPLQEARLTKNDIRKLSCQMGLPTWDKPSLACLASRVPYNTKITPQVLKRIYGAEDFLRKLKFRQVRVRHHGNLARIEVAPKDLSRILISAKKIFKQFEGLGYTYVTLDLKGYRTGSMNESHINRPKR